MADRPTHLKKNEPQLAHGLSSKDLTYKDMVDILEIIDHSTGGELHLEIGDLKLTVVKKREVGPSEGKENRIRLGE